MAIAFDRFTKSAASATDITWAHGATGSPRAVCVIINQNAGTTDEVSGVTYGGTAMSRATGVFHTQGTEDGSIYGYFLGSSVPTGAQNVVVNVNGTGSTKIAGSYSINGSGDFVLDDTATVDLALSTGPSVTLVTTAPTFICAGFHSGENNPANTSPGTGYTEVGNHDYTNQVAEWSRRTTNATGGNIVVKWNNSANEAAILAIAIKISAATGGATSGAVNPTAYIVRPQAPLSGGHRAHPGVVIA